MKNLLLSQKEYFAFVKSTLMYVLVHIFNKYHFVHTLWKLQKLNQIYCTLTEKISSNQLFNNFFSKNVAFTKFTIVESHIFLFFCKNFVKTTFLQINEFSTYIYIYVYIYIYSS